MTLMQRRINVNITSWNLCNVASTSVQRDDIDATSHQRRCNVMTLHRRWFDVALATCAHWVHYWHMKSINKTRFRSFMCSLFPRATFIGLNTHWSAWDKFYFFLSKFNKPTYNDVIILDKSFWLDYSPNLLASPQHIIEDNVLFFMIYL